MSSTGGQGPPTRPSSNRSDRLSSPPAGSPPWHLREGRPWLPECRRAPSAPTRSWERADRERRGHPRSARSCGSRAARRSIRARVECRGRHRCCPSESAAWREGGRGDGERGRLRGRIHDGAPCDRSSRREAESLAGERGGSGTQRARARSRARRSRDTLVSSFRKYCTIPSRGLPRDRDHRGAIKIGASGVRILGWRKAGANREARSACIRNAKWALCHDIRPHRTCAHHLRGPLAYPRSMELMRRVGMHMRVAGAALARAGGCRSGGRAEAKTAGSGYDFDDCHFHLTNYIQEGITAHAIPQADGDARRALHAVRHSAAAAVVVSRSRATTAPTYYLDTDAPLYYYSFTDAYIAMQYRSLSQGRAGALRSR